MEMNDFDNMLLALPIVNDKVSNEFKPMKKSESILSVLELDEESAFSIIKFEKKAPMWSEKQGSYTLNFGRRVKQPSVKNTQLLRVTKPGNHRDGK
jgi:hypothetical protein